MDEPHRNRITDVPGEQFVFKVIPGRRLLMVILSCEKSSNEQANKQKLKKYRWRISIGFNFKYEPRENGARYH